MNAQSGLRERKKQQTRELIAETARRLFANRGFERVTVAEIARTAEVSEATVFNYFPAKEDLVYYRMQAFEEEMLNAIRGRPAGESVASAFGRFVLKRRGLLVSEDPAATQRLLSVTRLITDSPALLAREREIFERYTATLAAVIASESGLDGDDLEAWVIANALMGVHRALVNFTREQVLAGTDRTAIAAEVRARGEAALGRLKRGLSA